MRSSLLLPVLLLVLAPTGGADGALEVASEPSGAEVWVAPAAQPAVYKKGLTPCSVALPPGGGPFTILLRHPGCLDSYHTVAADAAAVRVRLASRDDAGAWRRVPSLAGRDLAWLTGDDESQRHALAGVPLYAGDLRWWAPDVSGVLLSGADLFTGGQDVRSDLWWAPLRSPGVLLWRSQTPLGASQYFRAEASFAPNPSWVVFSAAEQGREHLRLHCLATGQGRRIAADSKATLFSPAFSPDGRRLACLRKRDEGDRHREVPRSPALPPEPAGEDGPSEEYGSAAELQVMQWDGSDRRTVALDAQEEGAPSAPAFSPDGLHLAYVNRRYGLSVVPVSGGRPREVLRCGDWAASGAPQWSPDGRTLAVDAITREALGEWHLDDLRLTRRVLWCRADGSVAGALPGTRLHGWQSPDSLRVYLTARDPLLAVVYQYLAVAGLDATLRATLRRPEALMYSAVDDDDSGSRAGLVREADGRHALLVLDGRTGHTVRYTAPEFASVRRLVRAGDAALWLQTATGPGYRLDPAQGLVERLTQPPELGAPGRYSPPPPDLAYESRAADEACWLTRWLNWISDLGPTALAEVTP